MFKNLLSQCIFLTLLISGCTNNTATNNTLPIRLEAEDYLQFFDSTADNLGGEYRQDAVDIEVSSDIDGGYNVGWTEPGEYLHFEITLSEPTDVTIQARVATIHDTRQLHYRLNGQVLSDTVAVPNTQGWQAWETINTHVSIPAGEHRLEVYFDTGLVNLNYLNIIAGTVEAETEDWTLIWQDEFNGNAIDSSKWSHEVNGHGGGNNELQYYTDRTENSWVSDGRLVIQALQENYTGADGTRNYTSARLRTMNKGDWLYGRMEISAKMPKGQGLWPAIWMLPTDWVYGGWAASGEIDIMEAVNLGEGGGNTVHGTLHYGAEWPNNTHSGNSYVPMTSVADNFHEYAIEWEPGEIRWYIDGEHYQTQTEWYSNNGDYPAPFNQRFHLILNIAVGGNWPGSPDSNTVFPQVMEVDYVRVYEKSTTIADASDSSEDNNGSSDPDGTNPNTNSPDSTNPDSSTTNISVGDNSSATDLGDIISLYPVADENTSPLSYTNSAGDLITRFGGRVRDRHAREDFFDSYQHFTPLYFDNRSFGIEVTDRTVNGGDSLTFNLASNFPWGVVGNNVEQPNFRAFYWGQASLTQYHQNFFFDEVSPTHFSKTISYHPFKNNKKIERGDLIEVEMGVFLRKPVEGRFNYYSRAFLYHVGEGKLEPWYGEGTTLQPVPMPKYARNGGDLTLSKNHSNESNQMLMQLALNIAPENTQPFLEGRRIHHSDFITGDHSEAGNPPLEDIIGLTAPHWTNSSCIKCHNHNAKSPIVDHQSLSTMVFKTNQPSLGMQLQTLHNSSVEAESTVKIDGYHTASETLLDGTVINLKTPNFSFSGIQPTSYSARMAPQLIGMGLLEAIKETDILSLSDPEDVNQDGISGVARKVVDAATGETRLGRFGWQAGQPTVRQQIAAALNGDMGVTTTLFNKIDCGHAQPNCLQQSLNNRQELNDDLLDKMALYVSLLGVPARRHYDSDQAQEGEELFEEIGCSSCHTKTFITTENHPLAELQNQTIHPFTDLLLHDLGPGLAATLSETGATSSEWRTAPLWGLTRSYDINGQHRYLHDGRAHSIDEAIVWHGGEATEVKQAYVNLPQSERAAVIKYLESL